MTLTKAGGIVLEKNWPDMKELAKEGAAILFSLIAIEETQKFTNGSLRPVRARVIVLTGRAAGQVWHSTLILNAGVRYKLAKVAGVDDLDAVATEPFVPAEEVDVVGRMRLYGERKNAGLDDELPGDEELARTALAKYGPVLGNASGTTVSEADAPPPF
jgi:hypothetical protein